VKFLLDTNIISEIRKRDRANAGVLRWVRATPGDHNATSVIVIGEILRGIELARRKDVQQAQAMDKWFSVMRNGFGNRVLPIDEAVTKAWSRLQVPDPLPLMDSLIAATALVHGLTLVTRNVKDVIRTGVPVLNPFEVAA
jgi:toxin FitB